MSAFTDAMTADLAVFFNTDEFSVDVLYNDGDGPAAIIASVEYDFSRGDTKADQATIIVKKSDVPDPEYRHTFTIDGVVWFVSSGKDKGLDLAGDNDTWIIPINKNERFSSWRK